MLETVARTGHARVARWEPLPGLQATTPAIVWPDIPQAPPPDEARIVVTQDPDRHPGRIAIQSTGTWFHPSPAAGPLVLQAPRPQRTDQVQVLDVAGEVAVFHDAGGWAQDPSRLLPAWIAAKSEATSGRLLWAPALGTPADYALWVYLGADLFDASVLILAAVRGEALTIDGPQTAAAMERIHGGTWDHDRLLAWNMAEAGRELARIALAVEAGTLRALVERRVAASPASVELLRRFDREHAFLASQAPSQSAAKLACMTSASLDMPEVRTFRQRMRASYRPPAGADILLLLPCSATKPYRLSPSHRRFARTLDDSGVRHRVHEAMVTSPLGVVPRELENVYPAQQYDVPVTGDWSEDEKQLIRRQVAALVASGSYSHIIAHVGPSTLSFLADLLPGAVHTVAGHPTTDASMRALLAALRDTGPRGDPRQGGKARKVADMQALLSFQFGPAAAAALCKDARATGKAPYVKLIGPEGQRGQTTPERGTVSLTEAGARILAALGQNRVHIPDFHPRKTSTLFAVGVAEADPEVRAGDEVVVVHGDDVRAGGVAHMAAEEMQHAKRGVAVRLRWTAGGA